MTNLNLTTSINPSKIWNFNFLTNNNKVVGWSFGENSFKLSNYYDNRFQTKAQNFYFAVNNNNFKMTYNEVKEFLTFVQLTINK